MFQFRNTRMLLKSFSIFSFLGMSYAFKKYYYTNQLYMQSSNRNTDGLYDPLWRSRHNQEIDKKYNILTQE